MNIYTNRTRWTSPILGEDVQQLYEQSYREAGQTFLKILEASPYEIAVISRMIAYLKQKKEAT